LEELIDFQNLPKRAILVPSKELLKSPVIFFSCECLIPQTCTIDSWLQTILTIGFDHIVLSYAGCHITKGTVQSNTTLQLSEITGTTLNDKSLCFVKHVYCGVDTEEEPNWVRNSMSKTLQC